MILEIAQNFPIQTFNGHCDALKTGPKYMTFDVPITLTVKNVVSGSFERCVYNGIGWDRASEGNQTIYGVYMFFL